MSIERRIENTCLQILRSSRCVNPSYTMNEDVLYGIANTANPHLNMSQKEFLAFIKTKVMTNPNCLIQCTEDGDFYLSQKSFKK